MLELRPEVAAFAQLMEAKLRQHDDRPGWKGESTYYLYVRLTEEMDEVRWAVKGGEPATAIVAELADVANFCMMLADVYGQLQPPTGPTTGAGEG